MRHLACRVVHQLELNEIPLTDADEFPRHTAPEGPERVIHPVGHFHHLFHHLQLHNHLGRVLAGDRRRNHRWVGQDGNLLTLDPRWENQLATGDHGLFGEGGQHVGDEN